MLIKTYSALSLDGSMTNADGMPVQVSLETFDPSESHNFPAFLDGVTAVAMGRRTFEPALAAPRWPWGDKRVYVLSSTALPEATPEHVVRVEGRPGDLVERLRGDDHGGDVHVVGGPTLIRGLWEIGAIDRLGLFVIPELMGGGLPLFPLGGSQAKLELVASQAHPDGVVELHYVAA